MTIARRYVPVNVTVPPGTLSTAPTTLKPGIGDVWLYEVDIRIPSGHAGLTGFYVANAGVGIVPWANPPQWVNGDNDYFTFEVSEEVDTGLSIVTYNTDVLAHTFYFRFVCVPISQVSLPSTTPIQAVS